MTEPQVLPSSDTPREVAIATSLIPWRKDDNRARYLGYLACGFMPEEALYMLGLTMSWLEEVRQEVEFSQYELQVPEIRKELSKEYIELDFFRNFRLVLEKDYRVLRTSLGLEVDDTGEPVTMKPYDQQYLLKMRSNYTPQQLQIIEQVISNTGGDFNFAQWVKENQDSVVKISRTDTVEVKEPNG